MDPRHNSDARRVLPMPEGPHTLHYLLCCLAGLEDRLSKGLSQREIVWNARNDRLLRTFAEIHGETALTELEMSQLRRSEKARRKVEHDAIADQANSASGVLLEQQSTRRAPLVRRVPVLDFEAFCVQEKRT